MQQSLLENLQNNDQLEEISNSAEYNYGKRCFSQCKIKIVNQLQISFKKIQSSSYTTMGVTIPPHHLAGRRRIFGYKKTSVDTIHTMAEKLVPMVSDIVGPKDLLGWCN